MSAKIGDNDENGEGAKEELNRKVALAIGS